MNKLYIICGRSLSLLATSISIETIFLSTQRTKAGNKKEEHRFQQQNTLLDH